MQSDTACECVSATSADSAIARYFGNVFVLFGKDGEQIWNDEGIDHLFDWLKGYGKWFAKTVCTSEEWRYLLFGREIQLTGFPLKFLDTKMSSFADMAKIVGIGLTVGLTAKDCIDNSELFGDIFNRFRVNKFIVVMDEKFDDGDGLRNFITRAVSMNLRFDLFGSYGKLESFKIFDMDEINSQNVTIIVYGRKPDLVYKFHPQPCSNFFNVVISPTGHIYPCFGLNEMQDQSLGTIHNPFEESDFATGAQKLDYESLAKNGFSCDNHQQLKIPSSFTLPLMCSIHRHNVKNACATTA